MAKSRQTAEELSENIRRQEQLDQVQGIAGDLKKRLQASEADKKGLRLLQSVSTGLYDEADKLSKKAPAEAVSDLMLEQVNDFVREAKELLPHDAHVQRLREFVPAGNNPQMRDVVIVLRQIRQGMDRFDTKIRVFEGEAYPLTRQADTIIFALDYQLTHGDVVDKKYVEEILGFAPDEWFKYIMGVTVFNFDKLNRTNITEHFYAE